MYNQLNLITCVKNRVKLLLYFWGTSYTYLPRKLEPIQERTIPLLGLNSITKKSN